MSPAIPPPSSFLIKPAGSRCNLACSYCYAGPAGGDGSGPPDGRMADGLLEILIRRVMELRAPATTFVWGGGEPTLAGLDFFRRAVDLQQFHGTGGQAVGNALQTNGTLLDGAWTRFLRDYRFVVGLSMDGPEEQHDRHRRSPAGAPSWAGALRAAGLLREAGVEFNILCVVTDRTAGSAPELYRHFRAMGVRTAQFLPCFGLAGRPPMEGAPTPARWGSFLCSLFDTWLEDPGTAVPFFDAVLHTFLNLPSPECTLRASCGSYLAIDADGSVFPCDFCMEPSWRLGTIHESPWDEILAHPALLRFLDLKRPPPPGCRDCEWLAHCHGGCPLQRAAPTADPAGPAYCESMRAFFVHAAPRLRDLARRCRPPAGPAVPAGVPA